MDILFDLMPDLLPFLFLDIFDPILSDDEPEYLTNPERL